MASAFIRLQLINKINKNGLQVNDERLVLLDNIYEIKPNGVDGKADYVLRDDLQTKYETNHSFDVVLKAIGAANGVVRP